MTLDGRKKPEYFALKKLLQETWSTEWRGHAQAGHIGLRGFYGEYELTAPGFKPMTFTLSRNSSQEIMLRLEPL